MNTWVNIKYNSIWMYLVDYPFLIQLNTAKVFTKTINEDPPLHSPPPPSPSPYRQIVNGNENLCNSHPSEWLTKHASTGGRGGGGTEGKLTEVNVRTKQAAEAAAERVLNHLFAQIKAEMEQQQQQQQQLLMVFLVAVMKMAHMATRCLRSATVAVCTDETRAANWRRTPTRLTILWTDVW